VSRVSARLWKVWQRNFDSFLRYVHVNLIGNLGEPVLYLVAMGYGLGNFLGTIEGVSYVQFLAPGIIVSSAMYAAIYECTYMSFLKLFHLKTYDAIIVTPVNLEDVVAGDIAWGTTKAVISGSTMFAVAAAFGLVHSPWALLLPLLLAVVGFHFASLAMLVTAWSPNFDFFSYFFELVIAPLFFCSGIFFPLTHLPRWMIAAAWCSPLTHAVELSRALVQGHMPPHPAWNVVMLAAPSACFFLLAIRQMRKRMIK
jgi:lipooligosaccharide transport system permease protein